MSAHEPIPHRSRTKRRQLTVLAALSLILLAGNILYAGCANGGAADAINRGFERRSALHQLRKPAEPESEWNAHQLWVQVGTGPALYIPRNYSRNAPRGPAQGEWLTDQRDGKKLFVPRDGAGVLTEGALRGEAIKITLWHSGKSIPGVQERPIEQFIPH
jgi:hypothetical protein